MGYKFTSDWFSPKIPSWKMIQKAKRWHGDSELTVIEIGSYEGRSACWILNNLLAHAGSKLYCIDTFEGSVEHNASQADRLYERFINNIRSTGKEDCVEVMAGYSDEKLVELITRGIQADLIYIDGSHIAKDVLTDAVLSWKLLKSTGVLIFDDYLWSMPEPSDINMNPKMAIDSFVNVFFHELVFIPNLQNLQFYIMKK